MITRPHLLSTVGVFALALGRPASASDDVPLRNWSPASFPNAGGHLSALADAGPPTVFVPMQPCRMVDTRPGSGFGGAYGPPALAASGSRDFPVVTSGCTGIPSSAKAVSFNFTVTGTAGPGDIRVFPTGGAAPLVSTLNYVAGQTVANAAVVALGGGSISVQADVSGAHLIVDLNGYFTGGDSANANLNPDTRLTLVGDVGDLVGVLSVANVRAHDRGKAGLFRTDSDYVDSAGPHYGNTAVHGYSMAFSGMTNTVYGSNYALNAGNAGVWGRIGSGSANAGGFWPSRFSAIFGVRGSADATQLAGPVAYGVVGEGTGAGVVGARVATDGTIQSSGVLGHTGTSGVHSFNNITAVGAKSFVEPHPTDPTKIIKYVSLEGPEAGTYFRGRGRFVGGRARIEMPEDFRMVTAPEGLTVQITPVGRPTAVGVVRADLDGVEVEATHDVEFFYTVNGVRRAFRDWQPIQTDPEFAPKTPGDRLESTFTDELRQRLVSNGTYNPDGSVNTETARRLGWSREWAERTRRMRELAAMPKLDGSAGDPGPNAFAESPR